MGKILLSHETPNAVHIDDINPYRKDYPLELQQQMFWVPGIVISTELVYLWINTALNISSIQKIELYCYSDAKWYTCEIDFNSGGRHLGNYIVSIYIPTGIVNNYNNGDAVMARITGLT